MAGAEAGKAPIHQIQYGNNIRSSSFFAQDKHRGPTTTDNNRSSSVLDSKNAPKIQSSYRRNRKRKYERKQTNRNERKRKKTTEMGWHVGLTYEEMQEQFGDKSAAAQSKNQQQEPSATTNSSSSTASTPTATACPIQESSFVPPPPPSDYGSIYHLCRKQDWETCVESKQPYFPRTFLRDGKFTRASLYLEDLIDVANEYYAEVSPFSEDWIVLQLDPHFLYHGLGIPILAAVAPESSVDAEIKCLQIFGGLSTHPAVLESLVQTVYPLKRRDVDGKFIGMLQNKPVCGCTGPKENDEKDDDEEELLELTMVQETPSKDAGTKTKKKKGFFSKFSSKKAPVSKD